MKIASSIETWLNFSIKFLSAFLEVELNDNASEICKFI